MVKESDSVVQRHQGFPKWGKVVISIFCPFLAPYHQCVILQLSLDCCDETLTILTSTDFEELDQNACVTDNEL